MRATAQVSAPMSSVSPTNKHLLSDQTPALETSLTFRTLQENFRDTDCLRILDLGKVRQEPLDYFCQNQACQYWFYPLLEAARSPEPFADLPAGPFDIILGWDRLSYLREDRLLQITQQLSIIGNRGTLFFASMKGRMQSISSFPAAQQAKSIEKDLLPPVLDEPNELSGLRKLLSYFSKAESLRSVLLQNGTQEIILRLG